MKYNVGDVLVNNQRGVITIIDYNDIGNWFKCKFYNKVDVKDYYMEITSQVLDVYCEDFKHYPCVKR